LLGRVNKLEDLPRKFEQALLNQKEAPISNWVKSALDQAKELIVEDFERDLARILIQYAYDISEVKQCSVGLGLAAAFDLFVAAQYYKSAVHRRWYYCPEHSPVLFYPFTNTCPRCILNGQFHFQPAHKPESGSIGQATSHLLSVFLHQLFDKFNRPMRIFRGKEPVDLMIYDMHDTTVLLAEIKAAPLVTLPLAVSSDKLTDTVDGEELIPVNSHESMDNPYLNSSDLYMFLPLRTNGEHSYRFINLGKVNIQSDRTWAYKRFEQVLCADQTFFEEYFDFWLEAFNAYKVNYLSNRLPGNQRSESNVFWLTNACGQPYPRPSHWPRRSGTGYESVSDGKTSVGMDRTDDIKKGIYQVLKIATESKPNESEFKVKTALISNIHAVRHYDEYLSSLEDVMWLVDKRTDKSKEVRKIGDLPDEFAVYNLFDGIISFTESHMRDDWIKSKFSF